MLVNGMKMKKRRKKRYLGVYTLGEVNKIIDAFVHPFANEESSFLVLDGVIHALAERDIQVSARKFIKYDLPEILKLLGKKSTTKRKRSKK
jgi:hypothetical protein